MTATTAYYLHTGSYDALVIVDPDNGDRMHEIGDAETFRAAAGDVGDLDNWSGDLLDTDLSAAGGDVDEIAATLGGVILVVHEGCRSVVLDARLLADRRVFYRA